jgi:5'-nucleotidase
MHHARFVFALLASLAPVAASCAPAAPTLVAPPSASAPAPSASAIASAPSCLSIVSWNDMHGQLSPDRVHVDTGVVPAGGVVAVADEVAAIRATGDAVVIVDAGDLFTGPLESSMAEGAPVILAYNVIGVDAAAIGNHEFDFGPVGFERVTAPANVGDEAGADGPRGALLARMSEAKLTFVSANVRRVDGAALAWPHFAPSVRVARGGFNVGIVGYTTADTPTTTMRPSVADLDFTKDAGPRVASEIRALRAAGASPVVLVAHASIEGELPQSLDGDRGDARVGEIARLLDALGADKPDLVVGGHRHAWMTGRVRGVPMTTSDQHGVGVARSRFCRGASGMELEGIERRVAFASSPPRSALGRDVAAAIAPALAKVAAQADEKVATIAKTCSYQALDGTALAEQIARSIASRASDAAPPPKGAHVVGVMNSGGVRAPVRAGTLRFADVFAVSPFENQVAVCATTRAGLARALENSVSKPSVRERFPFGIAGAKVKLTRKADGTLGVDRVELDGDGAKRDAGDVVWLAIPDFLLWGGDAFLEGVTCTTSAASKVRVRDVWRDVIAREQACDGAPKNVTVTSATAR